VTDDKPTDPTPPANPEPTPPANPEPTPTPAAPSPAAEHKSDDSAVLAAIGELKDIVTGAVQVLTTSAQPDESPAKKPWFARGGRS
jgi:hypothetical protein